MKRVRPLFAILFSVGLTILLGGRLAQGRPGGGSSFHSSSSHSSGSSSHSSSSSSHSSGSYSGGHYSSGGYSSGYSSSNSYSSGSPGWLFVPLIAIAIAIVIVYRGMATRGHADWETISTDIEGPRIEPHLPPPPPARAQLEALKAFDPNFSLVVFEDFLYALYAEVHSARGRGQLPTLTAYLGPAAVQALGGADLAEVRTIIVGALRVIFASKPAGPDDAVRTNVEIESNYTEVDRAGRAQAFYACERWSLVRRAGVLSRPPQRARIIACPSCGAPLDGAIAGRCRYCNTNVCTGTFDWVVERIETVSREPRGPMLTEETREEGTDLPTIGDVGAARALAELAAADPAFAWPNVEKRIGEVFAQFQIAWSGRDLASMRSFLSETLFQTQTYWIETYREQKLRNLTEGAQIERLELARVSRDRFFDAITVRLFAQSLDYTVSDETGQVVVGSRTRPRKYSEYWTFIRGRAQTGAAASAEEKQCPNCGGPLTLNMAGRCTHCGATVSSGEFDWVLSRIEQDEVYTG